MAEDENDRGREDDPFRDLDRFFAREDDRASTAEQAAPKPREETRREPMIPEPAAEESQADEDILPPGWLPESLGGPPGRDAAAVNARTPPTSRSTR